MHDDEITGYPTMLHLIDYLLTNYGSLSEVTNLVNGTELYICPLANPDGSYKTAGNDILNSLGNTATRANANGVDLNRTYGFKFNYDQEGASNHPCEEDYRGESAFSEPETIAIKDFIKSVEGQKIKIAFNYHSFGNILIFPFNFDEENSKALALNYTQQYHVYNDFIQEGHFPDHFTYGNGKKTVQ